jgi:hypothetical protein
LKDGARGAPYGIGSFFHFWRSRFRLLRISKW